MRVSGFRVFRGPRFRVRDGGLGFGFFEVRGFVARAFEFGVSRYGFAGSGFLVLGFRFRGLGFLGFRFRVMVSGFCLGLEVQGFEVGVRGFAVPGFGF